MRTPKFYHVENVGSTERPVFRVDLNFWALVPHASWRGWLLVDRRGATLVYDGYEIDFKEVTVE